MPRESLVGLIGEAFGRFGPHPAYTDDSGATRTFAEVAERISRLHAVFRELGVAPGDKVALLGRSSWSWAAAYLASLTHGAVAVPILVDFRAGDVQHVLHHSDSVLLFVQPPFLSSLSPERLPALKGAVSLDDGSLLWARKPAVAAAFEKARNRPVPPVPAVAERGPEEPAALVYTSGTTGFSKGVLLPHRSLSSNVSFARRKMPLAPGDGLVSFLPLAHAFGCAFEFLFPFTAGVHVTFLAQAPSPQVLLRAFARVRPSLVLTVPLVLEKLHARRIRPLLGKPAIRLLRSLPPTRRVLDWKICDKLRGAFGGRLREAIVGGAPLSFEVEEFLTRIRFPFTTGYGMTECGPLVTYAPWDARRFGATGRAVDGVELAVDSPDPARVAGEVLVRGENLMLGYYKSPEATAEAIRPDGWLRTGDLGTLDAAGFLTLVGRSKTMILGPSGQNVYPEEIEARLNALPYVGESLVVERNGRLVALVHPDYERVDADGLDEKRLLEKLERARLLANRQLPAWAAVSRVEPVSEEFEKTPTRKIKRFLYTGAA